MKRTALGGLIGLLAGIVGGAAYGYLDNSQPVSILSPEQFACVGACFFAPTGLIIGLSFGSAMSDAESNSN